MWLALGTRGAIACGVLLGMSARCVNAADDAGAAADADRKRQTYETWAGADVMSTGWSVHGGLTAALFGDVRDNGWRLRGSLSYGEYRYSRGYWDSEAKKVLRLDFVSRTRTSDAMLGYQQSWGPITIKAFAGITEESKLDAARGTSPIALDDENGLQGSRLGLKLALETWTRFGDWGYLQADSSWAEPSNTLSARARIGYRLGPHWSTGLEAATFGNLIPDQGRVGPFLRFEWSAGEASLSAGAAGSDLHAEDVYGTINILMRF